MNVNDDSTTKGFVIVCEGGDEICVADVETSNRFDECNFFKNVFRHGTLESEGRRIDKPDWTGVTAKGFVNLVTNGRYKCRNGHDYLCMIEACEQMLYPVKGSPFGVIAKENTVDNSMGKETIAKYHDVVIRHTFQWTLETGNRISSDTFSCLLDQDITISTEDDFSFEKEKSSCLLDQDTSISADMMESFRLMMSAIDFSLLDKTHPRSLVIRCDSVNFQSSVFKVYTSFCQAIQQGKEELSLRVPMGLSAMISIDAVCKRTGARRYFHKGSSFGFYLQGGNTCGAVPTFIGSFPQLKDTLDNLNENQISTKACSLRIIAPTQTTLFHLIGACQYCIDNQNSIGADFKTNALYAVKTVRDMKILLSHLANKSIGLQQDNYSRFRMVGLTYPEKEVF
jgi:hypothetical protein